VNVRIEAETKQGDFALTVEVPDIIADTQSTPSIIRCAAEHLADYLKIAEAAKSTLPGEATGADQP
jgi:hypothetical protein